MTTPASSVALVEDNAADARLMQEMVRTGGEGRFELRPFRRLQEALDDLGTSGVDCVLLDLSLPDASGLEGVETLRSQFPEMPVVIITGNDNEGAAIEALQAGAQDYLVKGKIDGDGVRRAVRYAIERKHADVELSRLGRQNELILDSAGEGICGLDPRGRITFANPAAAAMLGRKRDGLLGVAFHDAVHGGATGAARHEQSECSTAAALLERHDNDRVSEEDLFWRLSGASFPVEYVAAPIVTGDRLEGVVVTFSDITERKRSESRLQFLADHDMLTGLFNRSRFNEELSRQIDYCASYGVSSALLMLDLDNFKYVNDALGHRAGDELIRASPAAGISRRLRTTDVIGRLGGDEFAIVLVGSSIDAAHEVTETLLDLVRGYPAVAGGKPVRVTTSIGITALDEAELTAEQLLVEADMAMYEAKSQGRDRAALYVRGDAGTGTGTGAAGFVWTDRLRRALEEDLFLVYAQPIISLGEAAPERYELLIRMADGDGEIIPPGAFLPVAERFGLIQEIDAWMVGRAARFLAEAGRAGRDIVLEVNLSGRSIGDPQLPEVIERELESWAIDPADLVFEITETAAVSNMDEARGLANRVRGSAAASRSTTSAPASAPSTTSSTSRSTI